MIIIASQLPESILCTLPNGEQVEVTMLVTEQEDCFVDLRVESAVRLLITYFDCEEG
ncbi:MAG: hypothetical protein ACJARN_002230 [Arenicella sp.]|jgi:hypothetical protein